eukprot:TRINITY_DN3592_c0_g1_i11.p1 TRINITY_DN3592_c0_g1~~TRINITY_DN3592_c0_g1_i11.p1  ORF type:complete len:703 (+),score=152.68 TRINITY_DN3592_c0_g1_i11:442-2550(+)
MMLFHCVGSSPSPSGGRVIFSLTDLELGKRYVTQHDNEVVRVDEDHLQITGGPQHTTHKMNITNSGVPSCPDTPFTPRGELCRSYSCASLPAPTAPMLTPGTTPPALPLELPQDPLRVSLQDLGRDSPTNPIATLAITAAAAATPAATAAVAATESKHARHHGGKRKTSTLWWRKNLPVFGGPTSAVEDRCLFLHKCENVHVVGEAHLTDHHLYYFANDSNDNIISFVVTLDIHCLITGVEKENDNTVSFVVESPTNEFELAVPQPFFDKLFERYSANKDASPPYDLETALFTDRKFHETATGQSEEELQSIWSPYIAKNTKHSLGSDIIKDSYLLQLIHTGIPDILRGSLWQTLSGAIYLRETWPDKVAELSDEEVNEIERDVLRSMPEHPLYKSREGQNALRTILIEYARANPEIGYCQSMNMIAALFLLYMNGQQALRVLHVVCHKILRGYYTKAMKEILVDQQVFDSLVAKYLPRVHAHLDEIGVPTPTFGFRWFLCIFIHQLPPPIVLCIFDRLLTEGDIVLFGTGLALLHSVSPRLLASSCDHDLDSIIKGLVTTQIDSFRFFALVDKYCDMVAPKVARLRVKVRPEILGELTKDMDIAVASQERLTDIFGLRANRSFDMTRFTIEDVNRARHADTAPASSCVAATGTDDSAAEPSPQAGPAPVMGKSKSFTTVQILRHYTHYPESPLRASTGTQL